MRLTRSWLLRQPLSDRRLLHCTGPKLLSADRSASAKLFADATEEEKTSAVTPPTFQDRATRQASQSPNWDGNESQEDSVLRMLVDKYKPLRTGDIKTADDKLKAESRTTNIGQRGISLHDLPPIHLPLSSNGRKKKPREGQDPDDPKVRAETRRARRLEAGPGRLGVARERSLDYRIERTWPGQPRAESGDNGEASPTVVRSVRRPTPTTIQGWAALAEEKIQKAQASGIFESVEGRGKPLKPHTDEGNPFIGRDEFLLNRMIQRQGAAPQWVEIQGELESHIRTFREVMKSSWVRRASRNIMLSLPPPPYPRQIPNLTIESISAMRDPEWEKKEESYHNAALDEVNAQIRRHNGIAPFSARRGYLMRKFELELCYQDSAEEILHRVEASLANVSTYRLSGGGDSEGIGSAGHTQGSAGPPSRLWNWVQRLMLRLMPTAASLPPPSTEPSKAQASRPN